MAKLLDECAKGPGINSVEEYFEKLGIDGERTHGHRLEEIAKLIDHSCFSPVWRSTAGADAKIFGHRWVDTDSKSRLTVRDFKTKGKP